MFRQCYSLFVYAQLITDNYMKNEVLFTWSNRSSSPLRIIKFYQQNLVFSAYQQTFFLLDGEFKGKSFPLCHWIITSFFNVRFCWLCLLVSLHAQHKFLSRCRRFCGFFSFNSCPAHFQISPRFCDNPKDLHYSQGKKVLIIPTERKMLLKWTWFPLSPTINKHVNIPFGFNMMMRKVYV